MSERSVGLLFGFGKWDLSLVHSRRNPTLVVLVGLFALTVLIVGGYSVTQEAEAEELGYIVHLPIVYKKNLDLKVEHVKLIQGITVSEDYAIYIANRETFVRVFVSTGSGDLIGGVTGRLCGYNNSGALLDCIGPQNGPITAPSIEPELERTLNFKVPLTWIKPGYAYHVDLDPDHQIKESDPTNNRFPNQGTQPFNFVDSPALNVLIVPVKYTPFSSGTFFLPETGEFDYLTWMSIKVLPIAVANYQTHIIYSFFPTSIDHNLDNMSGEGLLQLLLELTTVHNLEDPTGNLNYYGLVNSFDAHGCASGCISGVSNQGATGGLLTGVGWSGFGAGTIEAGQTFVHELGHNFGRPHVNCAGTEPKPDINYPYQGGLIGQWGLDILEGILYDPVIYGDFMSYCPAIWTSDYTFWNIYSYRISQSNRSTIGLPVKRTLYVSGFRTPSGQVQLEPIYEQFSPLPAFQTGHYRVEMLGDQGEILAAYPFQMSEVADIKGSASFGFFVPAIDGFQGIRILDGSRILVEKIVPGQIAEFPDNGQGISAQVSASSLTLSWFGMQPNNQEIVYRLRVSQDRGRSWQVLALKLKEPTFTMPTESGLDFSRAIFEVQASDGIHTSTTTFSTYGE